MCNTAVALARERRRGRDSHWEPYVSYVFEAYPHAEHPANWSAEALALFRSIVGDELAPHALGRRGSFLAECGYFEGAARDPLLEAAYRIVVSRGWHEVLLPVVDMLDHRNGRWYNADQAGSAHTGEDISVVALRDIAAGEPIYLSYNECPDVDCRGIARTFTMPQMLSEYGFVEQYPRRFNIGTKYPAPVFELDEDAKKTLRITWLAEELPSKADMDWFWKQLLRLEGMQEEVGKALTGLEGHERFAIDAYFRSMLEGLGLTIMWVRQQIAAEKAQTEAKTKAVAAEEAGASAPRYAPLEDHVDRLDYDFPNCPDKYTIPGHLSSLDISTSPYQEIKFTTHRDDQNRANTCLFLGGWLHMCSSLRPHYHEYFVHTPAQFLPQVRRVLFLGGGDSMILHEVLKYPELELVVGMELDQGVVRRSFAHFGTRPHFHDDRVRWWFGDAAESMRRLPDHYLGTFDLVVVDLLTYVTESLMVTEDLNILEYSMLLLNEGGILTLNEDFVAATPPTHSQFSVDVEVRDVPVFCSQSLNMLSNTVDFLTAEPINHGVERLVVTPVANRNDRRKFDSWWNYHRNAQHRVKPRKAARVDASQNSRGVMLVLEAEEVTHSLESLAEVRDTLVHALKQVGLTVLSWSYFENSALLITLTEGYVLLRTWPARQYCAFDLVLWAGLDQLEAAEQSLVAATGAASTSSYYIPTGGRSGTGTAEVSAFPRDTAPEAATCRDADGTCDDPEAPETAAFAGADLDALLLDTWALLPGTDPVTVVFCPPKYTPCRSLDALKNAAAVKKNVVPIWSCVWKKDTTQQESSCEQLVRVVLRSARSRGALRGLVLDPATPRKMGQVLKRVLFTSQHRRLLLPHHYVLLAPTLGAAPSWRSALFEWFRTEAVATSPGHRAEVLFRSAARAGTLRLDLFAAGDPDFYAHLSYLLDTVAHRRGLVADVPTVVDGRHAFRPDPPPFVAHDASYDRTAADDQWAHQRPLGRQTVLQLATVVPPAPLRVGERVLGKFAVNGPVGQWAHARIDAVHPNRTLDLAFGDVVGTRSAVPRDAVRKWEPGYAPSLSEAVFVSQPESGVWHVSRVLETMPDHRYRVHVYDGVGTVRETTAKEIMRQFEQREEVPPPDLSCTMLQDILDETVRSVSGEDRAQVELHLGAGDGCLASVLWSRGSAVAAWDGGHHLDLNLFTYEEEEQGHKQVLDFFVRRTRSFAMVAQNEQPRGTGRVINFTEEITARS